VGKSSEPTVNPYVDQTERLTEASNTQLRNNRPTQSTPWATQSFTPTYDPSTGNTNWAQSTQLNGGLGQGAASLMDQYGKSMSSPFSFDQFGKIGTGDDARQQAIDASYSQATSRLNPQWDQRESQLRTQLLNQGLDPGTEAFRNQMGSFSDSRNDAYTSAQRMALDRGDSAGNSLFNNNMASRQQSILEALKQHEMPMNDLQKLQGFLSMPGYNQDTTTYAAAQGAAGFEERGGAARAADERARRERIAQEQNANTAAAGATVGTVAAAVLPYIIAAL
jgi:hypothetical protein